MVNRYNQIPPQVGNSEEIMAITITEGSMDSNAKVVQMCGKGVESDVVRGDSGGGGGSHTESSDESSNETSDEIAFHRHCQKTVCSAYGYNGAGKTWDVIYSQRSNLTNLPTNWIRYFTRNDENITQDLESILELINDVAATIAKDWHLNFYADGDATHAGTKLIWSEHLQPWKDTTNIYSLKGFSRDITLAIDGNDATTFKFNTMREMSGEKLSINLPKSSLKVMFNGVEVDTADNIKADNICMPNNVTFDIKQDFNKHPTCGYSDWAPIDGTNHVIRHHRNASSVTPMFIIHTKYVQPEKPYAAIIEWEFHLKNLSGSTMTVNNPVVKVGDDTNWFRSITALTDQMYVEPGKTNVYVFRADMYDSQHPHLMRSYRNLMRN